MASPRAVPTSVPVAAAALTLLACLGACAEAPVEWIDAAPVRSEHPAPLAQSPLTAMDTTLRDDAPLAEFLSLQDLLREAGAATMLAAYLVEMPDAARVPATPTAPPPLDVPPATDAALGAGDLPIDPLRCARSLRVALAPGRGRVAVWWTRLEGGRVALVAAWRDSSAAGLAPTWRGPIPVDTVDQGPRDAQAADRGAYGCARPAPGLAVDDAHGYVHVAYALTGPEGPGVFYAHQMDPRGLFEPPTAIVYGERLGTARVAAAGDVVAVAYEDPNSGPRTRIGLAVSRTSGHLFDDRLLASTPSLAARDPHVAVQGSAIVVGWSDDAALVVRRARIR